MGFFGTSESYDGYQSISGNVAFTNGEVDTYSVDITNWTQFGFGGFDFWDVSNGDSFALFSNPLLGLPAGYISGDVLSGTATQFGTSFAALGFETGSYLNTLSFEGITDTIVINVGQEVKVPVPSTLALFALGVFGLATRVFKN